MGGNACDDVFGWAARDPGRAMFAVKAGGIRRPVTAREFAGRVAGVAAGLIAAGIQPGDRIGLMSATSLDWVVCDLAIWAAGGVTVPVYETSSVEQIRWILADSGAVAVFAGNARCAEGIAAARAAKVEVVWQLDGGGLDVLARAGQGVTAAEIDRRRGAVTAATLATIVYTSGTTGRPKGCMISHGNLTEAVRAVTGIPGVRERVLTDGSSSLFFLPLSHILARVVVLCLVHGGRRIGFLADSGELPAELAAFRPTILLAVPRVFEKVAAAAREQAEAEGRRRLFAAAEATAIAYSRKGHQAGPLLRLRHAVFGRVVYARLRAALGGQVAWAVSGGAPLNQELGHFLRGAGITIMEGWGLTETTGPVTMNPPAVQKIGSVGLPLPGCAVPSRQVRGEPGSGVQRTPVRLGRPARGSPASLLRAGDGSARRCRCRSPGHPRRARSPRPRIPRRFAGNWRRLHPLGGHPLWRGRCSAHRDRNHRRRGGSRT
jgi:long-chain acyl-CoA synthetase